MTSASKPRRVRLSRRYGFQLAPLVDLLLIVVFAQFLEVRETVSREELAAKKEIATTREQLQALENELADAQQDVRRIRAESDQQIERTTRAIAAIASAFEMTVPDEMELKKSIGDEAGDLAPEVLETAGRVADASDEEVIRFLVGHAELLKRAEIWHLHADENRRLLLDAGERSLSIILERSGQDQRTAEVEDQLFAAYKQLPQPKGLVVILVSYSPGAVAGVYQPMIDGLPKSVERMRTDLPATRFEYTVLGTTPLPDVLKENRADFSPLPAPNP